MHLYPLNNQSSVKKQAVLQSSISLFICNGCGRSYKYKYNLTTHQRLECGKEPQFKCPFCDKRCHQKGTLKSHICAKHFRELSRQNFMFT